MLSGYEKNGTLGGGGGDGWSLIFIFFSGVMSGKACAKLDGQDQNRSWAATHDIMVSNSTIHTSVFVPKATAAPPGPRLSPAPSYTNKMTLQ
jgi:hypothetical protein